MRIDFLISSERSGSNLITKLLDNHSLYCGPTPPHLLRVFVPNISKYGNLSNDGNWESFINDIFEFHNCKIGVWETDLKKEELLTIKNRTLSSVVSYIYEKEAKYRQKVNLFIKEVKTYLFTDYILENFKNPKLIWLVRDPRDMALSWSISPVHRGDIIRASSIWKEDQKRTISIYNQLKKDNRIILIKYEDLISNQTDVLNKICSFLHIPFEESMIDFHKKKNSTDNALQSSGWKNLNKEIITKNSKKFQDKLTKEQIQFIEYTCKDEMRFLDYDFEFPLLNDINFKTLHNQLNLLERMEKPEYLLIDDIEKIKREKWFNKFLSIQNKGI